MRNTHNISNRDSRYNDYFRSKPRRPPKRGTPLFWSVIAFLVMSALGYADREGRFMPYWLSENMDQLILLPAAAVMLSVIYLFLRGDESRP